MLKKFNNFDTSNKLDVREDNGVWTNNGDDKRSTDDDDVRDDEKS